MERGGTILRIALFAILFSLPADTHALTVGGTKLEVSGWLPYWRTATSTLEATQHLDVFTEVNPFGYTVKTDGTLYDAAKLTEEPWLSLQKTAKEHKVRYIPTVMWSNASVMYKILSNTKKRIALEDEITAIVKKNGFDGIDIDFEGKTAETRTYFSTFLKGLYQRMGNKWVMCTIETRTPISDRYYGTTPPKDAGIYANDFVAVNKYCDRVRIMAYDQRGIDQKLAQSHDAELYAPVADIAWVEKVMKVAMQTISKKKLEIGIPTYGYEYDVTAYADGYVYKPLWTFNPGYAIPIAQAYGITPVRSISGEMSFSYMPTSTVKEILPDDGTSTPPAVSESASAGIIYSGGQAAATALLIASSTNSHSTFRYMVWSDAQAIADKIALAKKLGVRGVSIFKIDGGEDQAMWDVLR